jgi:ATP-binding cassette subfamily B protein
MVYKGYSALQDLVFVLCMSFSVGAPLIKSMGFFSLFPQINYKISQIEQLLHFEPLKYGDSEVGNNHSITFDHVCFSYEDKEVLHNVSLTIPQGTTTALVGESGSGKSTLAKLLVHFYDAEEGKITIGGTPISEISLASLNDNISFVSQEQFLFNTSIYENIRIGRPEATREEVLEAARRAECMSFIERLPDGIQTQVGECGKMLSGGERQRVSIARAMLKNAPVVILDEATAYTDPENEALVQSSVAKLVQGKTLLVIAHRLSTIASADQIILIKDGVVEASGTQEELLADSPLYRQMWETHMAVKEGE